MDITKLKTQSSLNISEEVIATIVQSAIKESSGVFSLSTLPVKYNLLKGRTAAKSMRIDLLSDTAQIEIAVVVDMNYKLKEVCEQVQSSVKVAVQSMTGIAVSKVNIYVTGVHVPKQE